MEGPERTLPNRKPARLTRFDFRYDSRDTSDGERARLAIEGTKGKVDITGTQPGRETKARVTVGMNKARLPSSLFYESSCGNKTLICVCGRRLSLCMPQSTKTVTPEVE